jgi:copper chaperone CopZ
MKLVILSVEGLHCEGCERSLEHALRRLDGVVSASADHVAKRLRVEVVPDRADGQAIRERVADAGFRVVS